MYVATQRVDSRGDMYDASGYVLADGTSFSAPLVAGAAAVLRSARPGLTVDQYRSLLIDSAGPIAGTLQQRGAGLLNLGASLTATATVFPAILSFGSGTVSPDLSRTLLITNAGLSGETFSVLTEGSSPQPSVENSVFTLAPGSSVDLNVRWKASSLPDGAYEGVLRIVSSTGREIRVPWWYGATYGRPAAIAILDGITSARRNSTSRDAILFRVVDAAGLPVTGSAVQVTTVVGDGLASVASRDSDVPGLYAAEVRLGPLAGPNVFRIQAGDAVAEVTITGN
jgi:hypothetical protein